MEAFRGMVKGWLGKSILGLIVFGLAALGLESYFGNGGKVIAAKVNGTEILQREVDQLVDRQRQQMLAVLVLNGEGSLAQGCAQWRDQPRAADAAGKKSGLPDFRRYRLQAYS